MPIRIPAAPLVTQVHLGKQKQMAQVLGSLGDPEEALGVRLWPGPGLLSGK